MPTYEFKHKETGEIQEHVLKIADYDKFIEEHPELERIILTAPGLNYSSHSQGSVTDIAAKKDGGWKEVLQKIGSQNPISEVGEKFHKKTIKQVKTSQVIEKHVKKQEKQRAERAARAK